MSNKFLLVISKTYWDTETPKILASQFLEHFPSLLNIPDSNISSLIDNSPSTSDIKSVIYNFIKNSLDKNPYYPTIYIYLNGYDNEDLDINGNELSYNSINSDESLDTESDLTLLIDTAVFNSNCYDRPVIIIISDNCSFDLVPTRTQLYFDWIIINSPTNNNINCNGIFMTDFILNILLNENDDSLSIFQLFICLKNQMKTLSLNYIPTIHCSVASLLYIKIFNP
jgi:hypothetical protein